MQSVASTQKMLTTIVKVYILCCTGIKGSFLGVMGKIKCLVCLFHPVLNVPTQNRPIMLRF